MAGIGLIIFGAFVTLFGYVLIVSVRSERHRCTNRTIAEITDIKQITNTDLTGDFFKVFVKYVIDTETIISTFIIHSIENYQPGKKIEILFNPKKPTQIISRHENTTVSPFFIIITVIGLLALISGILLAFWGI